MPTSTVVTLLCCSAEVNFFLLAQSANPHVNNIFRLTVQVFWDSDNATIYHFCDGIFSEEGVWAIFKKLKKSKS